MRRRLVVYVLTQHVDRGPTAIGGVAAMVYPGGIRAGSAAGERN